MTEEKKELYVKRKTENGEEEFIFRPTGELFIHIDRTIAEGKPLNEKRTQYYKDGSVHEEIFQIYDNNGKLTWESSLHRDLKSLNQTINIIDHETRIATILEGGKKEETFLCSEDDLPNDLARAKRQLHILRNEMHEKFPDLKKDEDNKLLYSDSEEAIKWRADFRNAWTRYFCEQPRFALLFKHFDEVFPKTEIDKEIEAVKKELNENARKDKKDFFNNGLSKFIALAAKQSQRFAGLNESTMPNLVEQAFGPETTQEEKAKMKEEAEKMLIKIAKERIAKKKEEKEESCMKKTLAKSGKSTYQMTDKDATKLNITINALKGNKR